MRVLVTGGAGYVGSHACKALARNGLIPVVYDDLRRGNRWAVRWGPLIEAPIEDTEALASAMQEHRVEAVVHFAAYAYAAELMAAPSIYFANNVAGSRSVLDAMLASGVSRLVVSSTCAVYGAPDMAPIRETTPIAPVNPYGASKFMMEEMVRWYGRCHGITAVILRYFNAAGADPEGEIGEAHDPEPHLIPNVVLAALSAVSSVVVNGTDFPTPDGTAVRDYVHVSDLAAAHVAALRYLATGGVSATFNIGGGQGTSIREVIDAVSVAAGHQPVVIEGPRRPGDPPNLVADASQALRVLNWRPARSDLGTIARTAVAWHRATIASHSADLLQKKG